MNLGFLDCAALVEVLADEIVRGARVDAIAELRVLRRNERWRKSENAIALGLVDGLNRLFSTANPLLGHLRRSGFGVIERSDVAKRFLMGRALGTRGDIPKIAGGAAR